MRELFARGGKRLAKLLHAGCALLKQRSFFFQNFGELGKPLLVRRLAPLNLFLEGRHLLFDSCGFARERIDFDLNDGNAVLRLLGVCAGFFKGGLGGKHRFVALAPLFLQGGRLFFAFLGRAGALNGPLLQLPNALQKHFLFGPAPLQAVGHRGDLVGEGLAPGGDVCNGAFGFAKLGFGLPGAPFCRFKDVLFFGCGGLEFLDAPFQFIRPALVPKAFLLLLGNLCGELVDRSLCIGLLHEVPEDLRALPLGIELPPTACDFRFLGKALDFLRLRLLEHVHALEVLPGADERAFGFLAPLLVLAHARSLFKVHAQLLGLCLDEIADHALADDGVGTRTEPGAHENVLDVPAAHLLAVDDVGVGAVARHHALDGKLGVAAPGAAHAPVGIVKHHLDRGARRGRPV